MTDSDVQINKCGSAPNKFAPTATMEVPEIEKITRFRKL